MIDEQKLRELAVKTEGWKLNAFNQTADNAEQGLAYVGSKDEEDGRFNDILEIDTGNYYQPEKAVEVAEFITAANPSAILALLDELQDLRNDRDSWAEQCSQRVQDAVDAFEKLEAMTQERTAWRVTAENAEKELEELKASMGEPVFWYRPVMGGEMYEGPHHNNSVSGMLMRKEKPGEWHPLYALKDQS